VEDYAPLDEGQEAHWEVVERILFLYAKLNPGKVKTLMRYRNPKYYAFEGVLERFPTLTMLARKGLINQESN
jgi:hypothetical protein